MSRQRCPRAALAAVTVLAALAALVTAGCATPGARASDASRAGTAFLRALHAGDGARACELLAPRARQELTSSAKAPCPEAVAGLPLPPTGGTPDERHTDVYGQQARVAFPGDTLFLAHFAAGWRVTAALCRPRPGEGQPYDCEIQG
ncbi:hypothetical protein [Streptomyces sp. 6N223]|uniref:hypothetical protein n=1 Tax=Streptomyces sp. 6N223 TaxID=3457412 RepID=UPI003FD38964